jgi:alcohol dehydrogenase class IV
MITITLKQDKLGLWSIPGLIALDSTSGRLVVDRAVLAEASERTVFERGLGAKHSVHALEELPTLENLPEPEGLPRGVLAVVGASSSKSKSIQEVLKTIIRTMSNTYIFQVHGRADHEAILGGIEALHRIQASHVIAIGGGTTLDVGKAIAGLAYQEDGQDIAAFQTGKRTIDPKKALPWIAVPTTSGTGSESTNNAVVELGDEKRSIRHIPPPRMIIADPAFTDSLPLSYTTVSLVDAVAQSLEVITHAKASPEVQAVALAAFLNLTEGMKALMPSEHSVPGRRTPLGSAGRSGDNATSPVASGIEITQHTRDVLSWGSLLMGIAFAHSGLGLPHALVHFCKKFGMSHGHMVGILLVPGLRIQARHNAATAARLGKVEEAFERSGKEHTLSLDFEEEATDASGFESDILLEWLEECISKLFGQVGLPTSLGQAGLNLADLDWIASQEHTLGASFGVPRRPATLDELVDVLKKAF